MTRIPIRLTPSHRSSDVLRDVHRDLTEIQREVRWLMVEQRLERLQRDLRAEFREALRRLDSKIEADGAAEDPPCYHDWPDELVSDSRCDRCGLAYDEWTRPGPDPTLDEAVDTLRDAGLIGDGSGEQ